MFIQRLARYAFIVLIKIINGKLFVCPYWPIGKQGDLIYSIIMLIARYRILADIRFARMIHKPRGTAHILAVDNEDLVRRDILLLGELVQLEQVAVLFTLGSFVFATLGFASSDNFAPVRVYKLTFL